MGVLKPLSQTHTRNTHRSHIFTMRYWNLCVEEEGGWAGLAGWPSGLGKAAPPLFAPIPWPSKLPLWNCHFPPLPSSLSHFEGKKVKKKKILVSFQPNQSLWVLFRITFWDVFSQPYFPNCVFSAPLVAGGGSAHGSSSFFIYWAKAAGVTQPLLWTPWFQWFMLWPPAFKKVYFNNGCIFTNLRM